MIPAEQREGRGASSEKSALGLREKKTLPTPAKKAARGLPGVPGSLFSCPATSALLKTEGGSKGVLGRR